MKSLGPGSSDLCHSGSDESAPARSHAAAEGHAEELLPNWVTGLRLAAVSALGVPRCVRRRSCCTPRARPPGAPRCPTDAAALRGAGPGLSERRGRAAAAGSRTRCHVGSCPAPQCHAVSPRGTPALVTNPCSAQDGVETSNPEPRAPASAQSQGSHLSPKPRLAPRPSSARSTGQYVLPRHLSRATTLPH